MLTAVIMFRFVDKFPDNFGEVVKYDSSLVLGDPAMEVFKFLGLFPKIENEYYFSTKQTNVVAKLYLHSYPIIIIKNKLPI